MTRPTRVPAKYARRKNVVHFKDAFSFSSQYTQVGTRAIRLPSDVDEVPSFTEAHDAVLLTCQTDDISTTGKRLLTAGQRVMLFS